MTGPSPVRLAYPEQGSASIAASLRDHGYCVVDGLMPLPLVDAVRSDLEPVFEQTALSVGPFYGDTTKRFHRLLGRSAHMTDFVMQPEILGAVKEILGPGCDTIQLNLTQAIEILPGGEAQPPHRDQDMWPLRIDGVEFVINVMWPFVPYTVENGATLVWPGSHKRQSELLIDDAEAVPVEMPPGSALLFLGSTLHAGGANRTRASRRGMIVSYSLGWLKPYELPWLAYPPEIARGFSPELAKLAGYQAHRPNLGTFEGYCPSLLLRDGDQRLGAVDVLRPDQQERIELYRSGALTAANLHLIM